METAASIASLNSAASRALAASACAGLVFSPLAAQAQDMATLPTLEELIPDTAVANPQQWAAQGVPADTQAQEALPAFDSATPMAEMPELTIQWPDKIELPEIVPLQPDEDVRFAELPEGEGRARLTDADVVTVTSELLLGFPQDDAVFPMRDEFVERFASLSTIKELDSDSDNIAQLSARAKQDQQLLDELLRVYGYYDGQVLRTVAGVEPGEDAGKAAQSPPTVRFDVLPGARYNFGAIDLGDLRTAQDAAKLRQAFEIQPGDPLSSDKIVDEQFDLDQALGENGYPFAAIDEPELLVDHARGEGDLTLPVRPNGKFVFGEVTSNLPDFLSGRHLAKIARFEPGDTYQRSLQFDLRRAVTATGLVSSVTVTPRAVTQPEGDRPGTVALDVKMTEAELRTIAGAIGYGTEEGIRVEASWEHRNIFPPEGSLRVRGIIGTQEQLAGVTFRKNNLGGRDRILSVDAYVSAVDNAAYDANTAAVVATFEKSSTLLFQKPLSWSFGVELVATDERPAPISGVVQPRQAYFVAALPVSALIDTTDDLLDPTKGFRLGGRFSPEVSRTNGAQSFYLRAQGDASYYQQVGDRFVLAGRVRLASIPGADLFKIAPSRRLYSGGGGSVRGYGYQAIGPVDVNGDPTGGRSLAEVAVEARIRTKFLDGAVSVVPFVDAGTVGPDELPDFQTFRIGAGVGLRYKTGFGPLRLDVATPINPGPNDSPVAVYVSLGQAF